MQSKLMTMPMSMSVTYCSEQICGRKKGRKCAGKEEVLLPWSRAPPTNPFGPGNPESWLVMSDELTGDEQVGSAAKLYARSFYVAPNMSDPPNLELGRRPLPLPDGGPQSQSSSIRQYRLDLQRRR